MNLELICPVHLGFNVNLNLSPPALINRKGQRSLGSNGEGSGLLMEESPFPPEFMSSDAFGIIALNIILEVFKFYRQAHPRLSSL